MFPPQLRQFARFSMCEMVTRRRCGGQLADLLRCRQSRDPLLSISCEPPQPSWRSAESPIASTTATQPSPYYAGEQTRGDKQSHPSRRRWLDLLPAKLAPQRAGSALNPLASPLVLSRAHWVESKLGADRLFNLGGRLTSCGTAHIGLRENGRAENARTGARPFARS
jgi:hypothetical protein